VLASTVSSEQRVVFSYEQRMRRVCHSNPKHAD